MTANTNEICHNETEPLAPGAFHTDTSTPTSETPAEASPPLEVVEEFFEPVQIGRSGLRQTQAPKMMTRESGISYLHKQRKMRT